MTPVRTWIVNELKKYLPYPTTFWSDTHRNAFYALTGLTHEDLLLKWEGPIDANTGNRSGVGTSPTFTTCTSFLPIFASKVRIAGNLPLEKKNRFSGLMDEIKYHAFEQQKEPGWVFASSGATPRPGDFFQYGYSVGTAVKTLHVGVILEASGNTWAKVAGGAGGRAMGHDGVKRTMLEPHEEPVYGWVDADVYFEGWDEDLYANLGSSCGIRRPLGNGCRLSTRPSIIPAAGFRRVSRYAPRRTGP